MSVCDHLVAPGSAGLFRAAIVQSGPCQAQLPLPEAERISLDYARDAGCGDPATAPQCLRALPADKLQKSRVVLPHWRRHAERTGHGNRRPCPSTPWLRSRREPRRRCPCWSAPTATSSRCSSPCSTCGWGSRFPAEEYPHLLSDTFGAGAPAVAAHYPLEHYGGSAALAYSAAVTDGVFACVADRMSEQLAATNPVYSYEFNDPAPPTPDPLRTLPFPVGASHSLELRYLFDVGGAPPLRPGPAGVVGPDDRLLERVRRHR